MDRHIVITGTGFRERSDAMARTPTGFVPREITGPSDYITIRRFPMTADRINVDRFPALGDDPAPGTTEEFNARIDRAVRRPTRRRLIVVAAGLALLILTLLPAMAVGAQSVYPPNTVVNTYYDPRYGEVAVVTDASGNLIDVNAATGQRIYPVFADYTSAYTSAYVAPTYVAPTYVSANYLGYSAATAYNGAAIYRQYTDNSSNCTNGQVTQTASGYYCTATGTPAFRVA